MSKYRVSLAVMRAQPFHLGHKKLIDSMLETSQQAVVVLGSIQEFGTKENPFSYEFRKQCIEQTYPEEVIEGKVKIMGLADVDYSVNWSEYVLNAVKKEFNLSPDAYFFGDEGNGKYFQNSDLVLECKVRNVTGLMSGTQIRAILERGSFKELDGHIPQATKSMLNIGS